MQNMTDEDIRNFYYSFWNVKKGLNNVYLKNNFKDIYDYCSSRYSDPSFASLKEIIYRIEHKLEEKPKCPICGKTLRWARNDYQKFCSKTCALSKEGMQISQEISKKTCLEKYGVEYSFQAESVKEKSKQSCIEKYGVNNSMKSDDVKKKVKNTLLEKYGNENYVNVEKCKQTKLERYGNENYNNKEKNSQTCLEKYNVDNVFKSEEIKSKIKSTCKEKYGVEYFTQTDLQKEKSKQTHFNNYGVEGNMQSSAEKEKSKQTCLEKYGADSYLKSEDGKKKLSEVLSSKEVQDKMNATKRRNNTFNVSTIEHQFEDYLKDNNIEYITQYSSEKYPYKCDFYIIEKDLYVEIQGSWTHGKHAFDCNNENDISVLESWKNKNTKFYENAIDTWTRRDVEKRTIAKQNNLNYIEIFSTNINTVIKEYEECIMKI